MMLQKILHTILIALILGSLSYIAIETIIDPTLSTTENRTLAKRPEPPHNIKDMQVFVQDAEAWWSDAIHFRKRFISVFNQGRFLLGISPQKNVIVGKDGWLFINREGSVEDYRNARLFTPDELQHWKNYLLYRHYDAERRGATYVFFVAPNKERIYGEYLPDNFTQLSTTSRFDQILNVMQGTPVHILDLRPALLEGKLHNQIYSKSDTHWNYLGSNIAQFAVLQYLHQFYPDIRPYLRPRSDYYLAEPADLVNAGMQYGAGEIMALGWNPNGRDELQPKYHAPLPGSECIEPANIVVPEQYRLFTPAEKNHFFLAEMCKSGLHRVLMFRDSFADYLIPDFSLQFNFILYHWFSRPVELSQWKYFMDSLKPDIVLDEMVERYLMYIPQYGLSYPLDFDASNPTRPPLDVEDTFNRADRYRSGIDGVTVDLIEARKLFTVLAEIGDARGMLFAGYMNEHGEGGPVDLEKALVWYEKSVALGNSTAMIRLADLKKQMNRQEVISK